MQARKWLDATASLSPTQHVCKLHASWQLREREIPRLSFHPTRKGPPLPRRPRRRHRVDVPVTQRRRLNKRCEGDSACAWSAVCTQKPLTPSPDRNAGGGRPARRQRSGRELSPLPSLAPRWPPQPAFMCNDELHKRRHRKHADRLVLNKRRDAKLARHTLCRGSTPAQPPSLLAPASRSATATRTHNGALHGLQQAALHNACPGCFCRNASLAIAEKANSRNVDEERSFGVM